jgi:hypothetical protein
MTTDEKLIRLKRMMRLPDTDDDTLLAFLDFTRDEILSWRYGATGSVPDTVIDVPLEYESVQLNAVMIGFSQIGGEGETAHNENGISRQFGYSSCLEYIHKNVMPYVGVIS